MFKIINKEELAKEIIKIVIEAPQIARKAKAGQFVVVIIDEKGERIPLTLADWDKDRGTINLIFQKIGYTTRKLGQLNLSDHIQHILGPLGHATQTKDIGTIICIGGGVGIAELYPVSKAFKEAGNHLVGIIGARSKDFLILEDEMQRVCDKLFIATEDGSYGRKGLVTDVLKESLAGGVDLVYAIGPVPMMRAVSELTLSYNIKTTVSLNPIMVDATGMCGSCRLKVGDKTVFGCVDGPEFDAHQVDFDELQRRLRLFEDQERQASEKFVA